MHKILIENECGCFRRSDLENNMEIANKDDAMIQALSMTNQMNDEFCGKHDFQVVENGVNFHIGFKQAAHSGCCGGGCHS